MVNARLADVESDQPDHGRTAGLGIPPRRERDVDGRLRPSRLGRRAPGTAGGPGNSMARPGTDTADSPEPGRRRGDLGCTRVELSRSAWRKPSCDDPAINMDANVMPAIAAYVSAVSRPRPVARATGTRPGDRRRADPNRDLRVGSPRAGLHWSSIEMDFRADDTRVGGRHGVDVVLVVARDLDADERHRPGQRLDECMARDRRMLPNA